MQKELRDERLQIMLTEEELAALDDWRFAQRMPDRVVLVAEEAAQPSDHFEASVQ